MSSLLAEQPDLRQTMRKLVAEARRSTFCDAASLVLAAGANVTATEVSDRGAVTAEDVQWDYREGPALQSLLSKSDFTCGDTRSDLRWPRWGPAAAELGWLSVVSKRLYLGTKTYGVLSFYATRRGAFVRADLEVTEFFARYASSALASAHERDALLAASETRHTIGIAEGILMQRYGLNAEAAFTRLRARGADDHTTLLVTAETIASEQLG